MRDFYLHAPDEASLATALPMLRVECEDGMAWANGIYHAMDAGFVVDGAAGYHANLRLLDGHPDHAAIVAAVAPFAVQPETPVRCFAGGPIVAAVPATISDRQFAQVLALEGVIGEDEALAWAARGELPIPLEQALAAIPEDGGRRFGARMLLASATTYERAHPLVPILGALLGYDAPALDDIWRRGAAL